VKLNQTQTKLTLQVNITIQFSIYLGKKLAKTSKKQFFNCFLQLLDASRQRLAS
jgi:hypothetical protein